MVIPFLAVAVALGVIVVLSASLRRRFLNKQMALPRKAWLLILALVPQYAWTHWLSHLGTSASNWAWILPVSYLPLICFTLLNLNLTWARVMAVGVTMNLAVMVANGGTMPAPARFSTNQSADVTSSRVIAASKDRISSEYAPATLAVLQDQYVVTLPGGGQRLASLGDFVSLGGAFLGLISTL